MSKLEGEAEVLNMARRAWARLDSQPSNDPPEWLMGLVLAVRDKARAQLVADSAVFPRSERTTSDGPRDTTSFSSRTSQDSAASRDETDPAGVPRKDT